MTGDVLAEEPMCAFVPRRAGAASAKTAPDD
jgi:hypothetical protein